MKTVRILLLILCVAAASVPGHGVITRLYPLGDVIADADTIVVAKVSSRDTKANTAALTRSAVLKGKPAWSKAQFRLSGGDNRTQLPVLKARLSPGRTVVLFSKSGKLALGYVEGTWFRLAPPRDERRGAWQFVHLEPYLRRTYRGTSADMHRTVAGVLAGKLEAPPPDPNAKPGPGEA
jgi:hypothetical protein